MKLKPESNFKLRLYDIYDQYEQYKRDKKAKKLFYARLKEVSEDRESLFNQYNLTAINNYSQIAYVVNIPEEFQLKGQQWQIMDKLNEYTYFMSKYLREDVGIGENLSQPSYYHIEDPSANTPLSCKYLVIWEFEEVLKNKKVPYIINTLLAVFGLGILGGLTYLTLNLMHVL